MYKGLAADITEGDTKAWKADGISFVKTQDGVAEYRLASGNYTFVVPYVSDGPIDDPAERTEPFTDEETSAVVTEEITAEVTTLDDTAVSDTVSEELPVEDAESTNGTANEEPTEIGSAGCKSSVLGGMAALLSAAGVLLFKKKREEI